MSIERTVDAATEPLTTAEAKTHLRVTHSSDDTYIDGLVKAARMYVEDYLGRALITQTWKLRIHDDWPVTRIGGMDLRRIRLPRPPAISVTSVQYVDSDGATQTLAADQYQVIGKEYIGAVDQAYGCTWPTVRRQADAITVTYTAGYGNAAAVPQPIKQAILLLIGNWYSNRSEVVVGTISSALPMGAEALLFPFRIFWEV